MHTHQHTHAGSNHRSIVFFSSDMLYCTLLYCYSLQITAHSKRLWWRNRLLHWRKSRPWLIRYTRGHQGTLVFVTHWLIALFEQKQWSSGTKLGTKSHFCTFLFVFPTHLKIREDKLDWWQIYQSAMCSNHQKVLPLEQGLFCQLEQLQSN